MPARHVPLVRQAVDGHRQWVRATAGVAPGPLADRLAVLGSQVQAGVLELYGAARRVAEVEQVTRALDPDAAAAAYKAAKRQAAEGHPPPELDALEARFASVQRMLNVVADADEQLRILDARLLAAVARGAELALTADANALASVGADLQSVVAELGVLRGALTSLS